MATDDMLSEAAPLAAALSLAARIGLDAMESGDIPQGGTVDDPSVGTLEAIGAPAAELRLAVLTGIAQLLGVP